MGNSKSVKKGVAVVTAVIVAAVMVHRMRINPNPQHLPE